MTQEYLTLFQIGPVQSFIASARRTQDLFVGSRLLSTLAASGVNHVHTHAGAKLLFPSVIPELGRLPTSVPHRFAYTSESPKLLAEQVKAAIENQWQIIYNQVRTWLRGVVGTGVWLEVFDRQAKGWLEIYWVAVEYDEREGQHGSSFADANRAMAMRKQVRHFTQSNEIGKKCTLTGAQSALPLDWAAIRRRVGDKVLRDNEELGTIASIKRFAQHAGCAALLGVTEDVIRRFPSTCVIAGNEDDICDEDDTTNADLDFPYYAILHMDGDKMGEKLSQQQSSEKHQDLSAALAKFAEQRVPGLVEGHRGELIYAGGDDVLALLPLKTVIRCANDIRTEYATIIQGTMSAGIAIAAVNLPLDNALEEARLAEHRAKEVWGRNAVVVRDARSNAIRECGAQWEIEGVEIAKLVGTLIAKFDPLEDLLSGKLGFEMIEIGQFIQRPPHLREFRTGSDASGNPAVSDLRLAREADLKRLLLRRMSDKLDSKAKANLLGELFAPLFTLAESVYCGWESASHWTILARFLARGGQR